MAAQSKPLNKAPSKKQSLIISTKHEHPDLNTREIGAIVGVDHSHVSRTLKEYGIDHERLNNYKNTRADILAGIQDRVLRYKYGTNEAIQKMPDAAAILLFNSCFNAERLERGQSTENVSVLVTAISDLKQRKRAKLAIPTANDDNAIDVT